MIVKVKGGYEVRSESGKSLGKYKTRGEAKKRLAQVEMFKHMESDEADFSRLWEDDTATMGWPMADGSALQGKSESDAHSDAQRASDEAHNATKNATTSKEKHDVAGDRHEAAAKAHYEAAEKASTKKRIQYHMNLGDSHTQQAMNLRACKWESHKIEPVKIKEGGPGSGPHKSEQAFDQTKVAYEKSKNAKDSETHKEAAAAHLKAAVAHSKASRSTSDEATQSLHNDQRDEHIESARIHTKKAKG